MNHDWERDPPNYSVFNDEHIVAYLWARRGAVTTDGDTQPNSAISTFVVDNNKLRHFSCLYEETPDFDAFRVRLEIEGYVVREGWMRPNEHHNRY